MRGASQAASRFLPPLMVMATIFLLSHQPGDRLSLPALPGLDKLAHLAIYGLLAASLIRAFGSRIRRLRPDRVAVFAILWCLAYGMSDEFHQSFVPGRFVSGWDLLADTAGAAAVSAVWLFLRRSIPAAATKKEYSS